MSFLRAPDLPLADPGTPPRLTPWRLFWWLATRRKALGAGVLVSAVFSLGLLPVMPIFLAGAVDHGLAQRNWAALAAWSGALVAAGAVAAAGIVVHHRLTVWWREDAAYRTLQLATRKVNRLGADLRQHVTTGAVVSVGISDMHRIRRGVDALAPTVGCGAGIAAVAYLLFDMSAPLGAAILLGVLAVAVVTGPLLGRLERRYRSYREQIGVITERASDIVAGLRVLRGIGGEQRFHDAYRRDSLQLRRAGFRLAAPGAWMDAIGQGAPLVLLGAVVWLSARQVAGGAITVGQMVAAFGYTAALLLPVQWLMGTAMELIEGRVACRKVCDLLSLPDPARPARPRPGPDAEAELVDPVTGLVLRPGLTALVCAEPDTVVETLDRLAGLAPSPATFGGVPVTELDPAELRARVLIADHDAYLFAGTVAELVAARNGTPAPAVAAQLRADLGLIPVHGDQLTGISPRSARVEDAVVAASAGDIVAALPAGLATELGNQARTLSGGQRQRLRLARALAAGPEVLLAVEPTSAVDSHTEARIAARLTAARAGLTTVVATTSPLWLGRADQVAYLRNGTVAATGTHAELSRTRPDYRALVGRELS